MVAVEEEPDLARRLRRTAGTEKQEGKEEQEGCGSLHDDNRPRILGGIRII
jgi:hypothetical protein